MIAQLAPFIFALVMVGIVLEMLRRKTLREKYAVLWLLVGAASLVLAGFPQLLEAAADSVGVEVPSNLLFALSIVFLVGVSLHLSWELSVVEDETRVLAEEVALLRASVEDLRGVSDRGSSSPIAHEHPGAEDGGGTYPTVTSHPVHETDGRHPRPYPRP